MKPELISQGVLYKQIALIFIIAAIPLIYMDDSDQDRAINVLIISASLSLVTLLLARLKFKLNIEWIPLLYYCFVLIAQQLFIPHGSIIFGAKYAVTMVAAFLPPSIVHMVRWNEAALTAGWSRAIQLLAAVMIVNVYGSRYFGFGEVHESMRGVRSFGFLGDSSAPLAVFLFIYFILEKRWIWASSMIVTMLFMASSVSLLVLAISMLILINMGKSFKFKMTTVGAFVISAWILQQYIYDNILGGVLEYSWNNRMISYQIGLETFRDNPIWGIGINQIMLDIQLQAKQLAKSIGVINFYDVEQVQNSFIRSLAETGILGCIAFLWICYILIRRAFRDMDRFRSSPSSQARSLVIAGAVWVIAFIVGNQSVSWFEHGHPQLSLLLIISAMTTAVAARSSVPYRRNEPLLGGS